MGAGGYIVATERGRRSRAWKKNDLDGGRSRRGRVRGGRVSGKVGERGSGLACERGSGGVGELGGVHCCDEKEGEKRGVEEERLDRGMIDRGQWV